MGRKLFLRHISEAAASPPPDITAVHSPEESTIAFEYTFSRSVLPQTYGIRLLAYDVSEYPDGNTWMLYTEDDGVDPRLLQTFEVLNPVLSGKSIPEALLEVSRGLTDSLTSGLSANPINLDGDSERAGSLATEDTESEADGFFLDADSEDDNFGLSDPKPVPTRARLASTKEARRPFGGTATLDKIKSDLRATKAAGFRIGIFGDLVSSGIVSVSIRVTKLGISEEAMQAWSLKRHQYLVLLIRFQDGYRDLAQVKEEAQLVGTTEMRVGLCDSYKPHRADALAIFNQTGPEVSFHHNAAALEPLFIGRPLNDLLREKFCKIIKFRESCGFNWASAEAFVDDVQGKAISAVQNLNVDEYVIDDTPVNRALPAVVMADAVEGKLMKNVSLPLAAMQFVLRHLVRCTEFCLVCHRKVEDTFEALKPYVCSRGLCLYQYMALGFGPSIEWEVLTQPYVVDLLVSFCYAAARQGRLKEFPHGIDLKMPGLPHYNDNLISDGVGYRQLSRSVGEGKKDVKFQKSFSARMDFNKQELLFDPVQKDEVGAMKCGDWLVLRSRETEEDYHCRVEEAMFPTFRLSAPAASRSVTSYSSSRNIYDDYHTPAQSRPATPPKALPKGFSMVDCFLYSHAFDGLSESQKHHAIVTVLETLPSVLDMQKFLKNEERGKDPNLKSWRSGISESALNILRWIIASNRSCIMQDEQLEKGGSKSSSSQSRDDRVGGMDSWMQFRFAQGAPDKEQRFIDCVKQQNDASSKKYPTLFAWHGSPLANWHSIIRQGLRFDEALHGRAFGDGVYMSPHASTSAGYSNMPYRGTTSTTWPKSALKISSAFSLNEVVNMPEKFVSRTPHYVVNDIDWIQTRYLFVKSELAHTVAKKPDLEYEQDPKQLAYDDKGKAISVPITAVSKSRRPVQSPGAIKTGLKKLKNMVVTDEATAEQREDDANSMVSDDTERNFLDADEYDSDLMSIDGVAFYETTSVTPTQPASNNHKHELDADPTDFVPGSLDLSSIKFLDPPKNASPSATKALMQAYKHALKTQHSEPLSKLGWWVHPDISNMYQWIVELHSFNPELKLAKDMKSANVTSIVLEMRFTNQYPFSPPFIRVVKPRFLPFNQGGGGHVTEGGAICMELLTNTGWSAVTSIDSVLLQVQLAMCEEERPGRLMHTANGYKRAYHGSNLDSYGVGEAVAAYERACRAHGWAVPEGFTKFQFDV